MAHCVRITRRWSDLRGLAAMNEEKENTGFFFSIDVTVLYVWQLNAAESMFTKPREEFTLFTDGYFTALIRSYWYSC